MPVRELSILIVLVFAALSLSAQQLKSVDSLYARHSTRLDSGVTAISNIPKKYFTQVDKKIDQYTNRITNKTEKTLAKLSKWELRIKGLLEKASPETAKKLFAPNQITFTSMLQNIKEGKQLVSDQRARYHGYTDKLETSIKYLQSQKNKFDSSYRIPLQKASEKIEQLNNDLAETETAEKLIKQRKKQLVEASIKFIGKSKYLTKINKESYYYIETLRNYKEIFSDPQKTEATASQILSKIPAFKEFTKKNSILSSLFGSSNSNSISDQSLDGLQTRTGITNALRTSLSSGGSDAKKVISQNIQEAQQQMSQAKDEYQKKGMGSSGQDMPGFKPNKQKSKTFKQRLEYECNYQFGKSNKLMPSAIDIALGIGYKLDDKSVVGLGLSYKMGFGSIDKINFTHQGIGIRSYLDWKLKKQFFVSGGFEMNYHAGFKNVAVLQAFDAWQSSGLIGITKKIALKTKFTKGTKLSLLYDVLHRNHVPVSQPIVFRIGYNF